MSTTVSAFPLAWPAGWKRTPAGTRRLGKFTHGERVSSSIPGSPSYTRQKPLTVAIATERLIGELTRMGIPDSDVILSTNLELRRDGLPRSGQNQPADPGAAVYWRDGADQRCMATDIYCHVEDNIAALAATIEAMRAIERHGGAQILNRAFAGFAALPAPGQVTARSWRAVLEIADGVRPTLDEAQQAFRRLAAKHHPDRGGLSETMAELNGAWAQAQEELRA